MKKILALAMVFSVFGAIVAGCSGGESASTDTAAAPKDSTPKADAE